MTYIALQPLDELEVITVVDNYTDILMPKQEGTQRYNVFRDGQVAEGLLAEHGLSLLIKVRKDKEQHLLLLDGGWSELAVPYNLTRLGITGEQIEGVVLSHGHMDHFSGLPATLRHLNRQALPLYCHPEVFRNDRFLLPGREQRIKFPVLSRESLVENGALLAETREPRLLANGMLALTGEIARTTAFETGMASAIVATSTGDLPDPFNDDQGLVAHIAGKGLVVISGCAHAGIINTIRWAQQITGIDQVYAVLGGFHLSGPAYRRIVEPTLQELQQLAPEVLVPMHCTGWQTIQQIAQRFPKQFIPNCVGSKFVL